MANPAKSLSHNVAGNYFVDSSCIDCDTCRWMAPQIFGRQAEQSYVMRQPQTAAEEQRTQMALLACPTASIGAQERQDLAAARAAFPDEIVPGVYHCGYHDEASFGATAFLITRPAGNVLVDVPRFTKRLVRQIEDLGGIDLIFLSHQDDVGSHAKWAAHFQAPRLMHEADVTPEIQGIEELVDLQDELDLADDLKLIATPGHSRGSLCLLFRDEVLFTGDHLAFSPRLKHLYAFREYCGYDWQVQTDSMKKLLHYDFSLVLPGHGRSYRAEPQLMKEEVLRCITWMESF